MKQCSLSITLECVIARFFTKYFSCSLGPFGATFVPGILSPSDAVIFTARAGLRVWRAGMDGVVQSTMMFKELIQGNVKDLDLLEDTAQPIPVNKVQPSVS